MTVYAIISSGYGKSTRVYGIYPTLEKAEEVKKAMNKIDSDRHYTIQETTFNKD